jgi:hypothetical protein
LCCVGKIEGVADLFRVRGRLAENSVAWRYRELIAREDGNSTVRRAKDELTEEDDGNSTVRRANGELMVEDDGNSAVRRAYGGLRAKKIHPEGWLHRVQRIG